MKWRGGTEPETSLEQGTSSNQNVTELVLVLCGKRREEKRITEQGLCWLEKAITLQKLIMKHYCVSTAVLAVC